MITYKERLDKITTFIFDIDGVLTNGDVIISETAVLRTLSSRDGQALRIASSKGFPLFVISGGNAQYVKKVLMQWGVKDVFLNISDKLPIYEQILKTHSLTDSEILYMGDDLPDYPVMKRVGCATCPNNAAVEIKEISHYCSPFIGGTCAVRDVIEQTLRLQEKWSL